MAHIPDDLLLAVVARRLDLVSPEGLKQAVEKWAADPTRTLGAILGEMGLLAEEVRRALAELIKSLRGRVGESLLSEVRDLNLNENTGATDRILEVIGEAYQWPDFPRPGALERPLAVRKDAKTLAPYQGYCEFSNNNMIRITAQDNKLVGQMGGSFFDDFLPAQDGGFFGVEMPFEFLFEKDARGEITHFTLKSLKDQKTARKCPRIIPHLDDLVAHPDPDPSRTAHIRAVLKALAQGDKALESAPRVTPGAQRDLGAQRSEELAGLESLTYITEQDVAGRGVTRHDGKVGRVVYYKFTTPTRTHHLLIHLTSEGLFTDMDVVDE
jgi:hypothetical protein